MSELSIIGIIWLHFLSDFILQSDKMANNKSTNNKYLTFHCVVYSIPMLIIGLQFAIVNGILHFMTDWVTSRVTSKLYKAGQIHWFFVVIGFDQAIHLTTLLITFNIFGV